jgi:RNA polymerase sigma-70 factor (ECF subfamily)
MMAILLFFPSFKALETLTAYTDTQLFALVARGDEAAFEVFFHRYTAKLFPFLLSMVKADGVAREIIQESFLKLWLNREKLAGIDNPGGWIRTVAMNTAYNHLRSKARYEKYLATLPDSEPTEDLELIIDARYAKEQIARAVEQLPPKRRQVFELSRYEGLSRAEIADRLQISEFTVRNQLREALQSIQEYLRKNNDLSIPLVLVLLTGLA